VSLKTLPSFYGQQLGPTLKVYLEKSLDLDPSEQLSVLQELGLMRHRATSAVGLYSAAVEALSGKDTDTAREAVSSAADMMASALRDVAEMARVASLIRASNDDKIDAAGLNVFIQQVLRIIFWHLGDHPDIAKAIERDMREEIRMPVTKGTAPTPAEVAADIVEIDNQFV